MATEQIGLTSPRADQSSVAGPSGISAARPVLLQPSLFQTLRHMPVSRSFYYTLLQSSLAIVAGVLVIVSSSRHPPPPVYKLEWNASAASAAASPRVCNTLGCTVTAAQTVLFVNRSVDPCEDFFHFACGAFDEAHPSGTRSAFGVRDVLERRNRERLLQLLSQRQLYNSSSATSKARLFFETCTHAFSSSMNAALVLLVKILVPLGGLDLMHTWQPDQWDFNEVLANASKLHLTEAFFTLTWNREDNLLNVRLPKLALDFVHLTPEDNSRYHAVETRVGRAMREVFHQLEQDFMVVVDEIGSPDPTRGRVCMLNSTNTSDINQVSPCVEEIVRDILSVEGELLAIDPQRVKQVGYQPPEMVTLAEMARLVPQIDWRRLLDALFGTGAVPDAIVFEVPSVEHMAAVGRIIDNTRVKRLHHFLMWPVIRRYLVALGPIYATLAEELDRNYKAEQLKTREEQCLELLDEHMAPAMHALLLSIHIGRDNTQHVRTHLLDDAIKLLNDSFGWMSKETQRRTRVALESMQVKFGYTSLVMYERELDLYYSPLELHVVDFFVNLEALYDFNRPGKIYDEFPSKGPPESVRIQHDFAHGTLWVPFGALQPPWYHANVPSALNAASLGSLIFEALAVPFIQIHLSPENLTNIWDTETESRFEHYYNCLLEQVRQRPIRQELAVLEPARSGLRFAAFSMRVDPVPATFYMIADQFAYQLSYRLFHQFAARDGNSSLLLPGLPVTNSSQAFFMAFAQARCRNDYALWDDAIVGASKTLQVPEAYVINKLMLDDPRFREAFQCPSRPHTASGEEEKHCSLF